MRTEPRITLETIAQWEGVSVETLEALLVGWSPPDVGTQKSRHRPLSPPEVALIRAMLTRATS